MIEIQSFQLLNAKKGHNSAKSVLNEPYLSWQCIIARIATMRWITAGK